MATIGDVKLSTNETSVLLSSCPSAPNYSQGPGTRPTGCGKAILKMPSNRSTTAMFLNPFVWSGSRQVLKSRLHITNQLRRILSTRTVRLFKKPRIIGSLAFCLVGSPRPRRPRSAAQAPWPSFSRLRTAQTAPETFSKAAIVLREDEMVVSQNQFACCNIDCSIPLLHTTAF